MTLSIWKLPLRVENKQSIEVPLGAEFLCAREQHDKICVWFRGEPGADRVRIAIEIVGTGHPAPAGGRYLGTAALHGGDLMFHVFEMGRTA